MIRTLTYTVLPEHDGERTDSTLRKKWGISGSLIKDLKKFDDGILLNGEHTRTIDLVHLGDVLTVNIHDGVSENIIPHKMPLDIIYEDEDILIVNKPPKMPTHPSIGHFEDTLANGVMAHFEANNEQHIFRAVNRLDGDTSGVMCIAKNSYAHARLGEAMHSDKIIRKYTAIVCGEMPIESGKIDAPIARVDFIKREINEMGQRAITNYKVIASKCGYSLVELILETGRTHQIRVHMSYIKHPLLGDWLYGIEDKELFSRHALHSSYLKLIHPVSNVEMEFIPKAAKDMKEFWESL